MLALKHMKTLLILAVTVLLMFSYQNKVQAEDGQGSPAPKSRFSIWGNKNEQRQKQKETRINERQQKREELKEKLKIIKDDNKRKTVESLNERLNDLNQNASQKMLNLLEKMTTHLTRLSQIATERKNAGKDTAEAEAAINKAKTAIETAKAAAEAQKLKVYTITFTQENGLRIGATQAKTSLRADLKAVREKVRLARQAVVDALKIVKTTEE